jgi:hypothetical protein
VPNCFRSLRNDVPREIGFLELPCGFVGELEPRSFSLQSLRHKQRIVLFQASPAKGLRRVRRGSLDRRTKVRFTPQKQTSELGLVTFGADSSGSLAMFAAIRRALACISAAQKQNVIWIDRRGEG